MRREWKLLIRARQRKRALWLPVAAPRISVRDGWKPRVSCYWNQLNDKLSAIMKTFFRDLDLAICRPVCHDGLRCPCHYLPQRWWLIVQYQAIDVQCFFDVFMFNVVSTDIFQGDCIRMNKLKSPKIPFYGLRKLQYEIALVYKYIVVNDHWKIINHPK